MATKETISTPQVKSALRAFIDYGESEYLKSQQGYFSGSGFAARALRYLLDSLENGEIELVIRPKNNSCNFK